jgi:hypothetical protein
MNENITLLAVTLPVLLMVGFGNVSAEGSYTWTEHTNSLAAPKTAALRK